MKVGILTFHRAHNFGAQMQMYALYKFLKNKGYDVHVLDYYCSEVEDIYIRKFRGIRAYINRNLLSSFFLFIKDCFGNLYFQKKKKKDYNDFLHSYFQLTHRFSKPEDLPLDFDALITGSDQVWGYHITKGRKEVFFLDNKKTIKSKPKRISYAASSEINSYKLLENDACYIKNKLSHFSAISVREEGLANLLYKISGLRSKVVLDPTFLLKKEDYLHIAIKPSIQNYLCVYQVSESKNLKEIAQLVASERNLQIVEVKASLIAGSKSESYGPKEILGLLLYSDVIVTSSFHGTAFSVICRKDFYSVFDFNSMRVKNLLKKFNLENRYIMDVNEYQGFSSINYDNDILNKEIYDASAFLINSLDNH